MQNALKSSLFGIVFLIIILSIVPAVHANTFVTDLRFVVSQAVYTENETISLKGTLYISNYTDNGTLVSNHTAVSGGSVKLAIINNNTNATSASYTFTTTSIGEFYSRSSYYPTATLVSEPSTSGSYRLRANYTDANNTTYWTEAEILVVNQAIDRLNVITSKADYSASDP